MMVPMEPLCSFKYERRIRAMNRRADALKKEGAAFPSCVLFHPDYTVGPGITPDLLTLLAKTKRRSWALCFRTFTAGGESHPALRTFSGFHRKRRYRGQRAQLQELEFCGTNYRAEAACPNIM